MPITTTAGPGSRAAPHFSAPHLNNTARTVRTGGFFLPGDPQQSDAGPWQLGPAWVQWEAPADGAARTPWVLVHGGGGQSTDWLGIEDGAPGWAPRLVDAGFPAYLLDRPGHGRSPYDPARLGGRTGFPDYAGAGAVFAPEPAPEHAAESGPSSSHAVHSAWPWGRRPGSPELDQLVASSSGMLTATPLSQDLDARRIVDLLERTGPAVLATHSAGAAGGWLAAARSPHRVRGIVTFEPLGPPFRDLGPRGRLDCGLTAVPLAAGASRPLARQEPPLGPEPLGGLPVLVVSGPASGRAGGDAETVDFLNRCGARATHLRLEDLGIHGNGHGLIFENNLNEILEPVLEWLAGNKIT
ncbi:pimeloyl-ACP methyl ester carboxylesterase [Arthrobacter ginsengisoli]|uniref:Pimeloyl-ACP methyl ester carboxylesterase n=1 Tax=Arthrobacter ginsengisoli TaxID=1356565 RepID=A0ABU1UGE8_9MICC|nr:alpha/beta fold hydrolase [Arthrobacter ginsengisoli]MDR7084257.1 pimeloyl-ACP methyl ester carboxylesterase [Arthrobacter ginsengisoli]